jgi:hypothetical protein
VHSRDRERGAPSVCRRLVPNHSGQY